MRQAAGQAASSLRDALLTGRIPAGARVAEMAVARQLSMNRTPIREALSHRAAGGPVELSPNRGARVTAWSKDEPHSHLYNARATMLAGKPDEETP